VIYFRGNNNSIKSVKETHYSCVKYIQGVPKITRSTSGSDSGSKKKEKSYKHKSGNKSFPSYSHFYVKKIVIYNPLGNPFF